MEPPTGRLFAFALVVICALNLIVSIDQTSLAIAIPTIAQDLDAKDVDIYWAGTSFLLCSAVFQPVITSFSNAFGRKAIILLVLSLFTIGSVIAAVANHVSILLLGRSIQGVGGGGIIAMTYVLLCDLFSLRDRGKGIGLNGLVWMIGTITGPVLGGGFAQHASWVNFNSLGGIIYPWNNWGTIVPLVIGSGGLVIWVLYELRMAKSPLIPLKIFGDRTAGPSFFGTFIHGAVQFGLLYFLPLYYQAVKSFSPTFSGLALFPQCILSGPTTAVAGIVMARTGRYRTVVWAGWITLVLGVGILHLLSTSTTTPQWIFINIVSGIGLGLLFSSIPMATQAAASDAEMTVVAGLNPFVRTLGQSFGIAIGNAAFQNEMRKQLAKFPELRGQADAYAKNAAMLATIVQDMSSDSIRKQQIIASFVESLRVVWWILLGLVIVGGLASLFIEQLALDRPDGEVVTGVSVQEAEKDGDERKRRGDEETNVERIC
ncbi:MAG: hypothetical protein M1834_007800 [Cirrosporium novae-zelandiae]|nr:MAG: hypothetical protein M1834_007800 [Cirrosporium novae-zelandiae]